MSISSNKEREVRIKKLEKLEAITSPYPYSYEQTCEITKIKNNFEEMEGKDVSLSGRIFSKRDHGKTLFMDLKDFSGKIQLYFRSNQLGDKFSLLELIDIGDHLGVKGKVFKTRMGEITVDVRDFELLAKTLRPLPEKWHGIKDKELIYRHRYLDLLMNEKSKEVFLKKTKIIKSIREFLDSKGFIEVETPILQPIYGGATANPFRTYYQALKKEFYLRIADELYLKRMLVGGFEKVYEIGKDFRNEGIDRFHNPEFIQVEIYQAYKDYLYMMEFTEELFRYIARDLFGHTKIIYDNTEIDLGKKWKRIKFVDALKERIGKDPLSMTREELWKLCKKHGIETKKNASSGKMLEKLFDTLIQDHIEEPTFVMDHPKSISPLAKTHRNNPFLAERFELVIKGIELGNAFSELNNPLEQRERFEEQIKEKEEYAVIDEDFLLALEYGMPPAAGLGLGIDRITMLFTNSPSIRDVILFPQLAPESNA